jgi:hypothetical protein
MTASAWTLTAAAAAAIGAALCLCGFDEPPAHAQPAAYALAPVADYLMDRDAEIALARSAAPASISRDATVMVLTPHGYEVAVKGTNGFVCMVERGLLGTFDWAEHFSPKIRGADCLNPQAARSIVPLADLRTRMALEGRSTDETVAAIRAGYRSGALPPLEPGAMSYMMSKDSYLTDIGHHNAPHLMFFMPIADKAAWGADAEGSPVGAAPYWFFSKALAARYPDLPPLTIFVARVPTWSDGSPASHAMHALQ